jgi:hypothetical protein
MRAYGGWFGVGWGGEKDEVFSSMGHNMVEEKGERMSEREKVWNFIISGQFHAHKGPNVRSHCMFLQHDTSGGVYIFFYYVVIQ